MYNFFFTRGFICVFVCLITTGILSGASFVPLAEFSEPGQQKFP